MAVITCRKCGTAVKYEDQPPVGCATCGAIYAKVEAAAALPPTAPPARPAVARGRASASAPSGAFIGELRTGTNYPAFRTVTNFAAWLWYLVAIGILVAAIVKGDVAIFFGALATAILIYILARAVKEASIMFADLSDAAVYTAERARDGDQ